MKLTSDIISRIELCLETISYIILGTNVDASWDGGVLLTIFGQL